MALSRRDFLKLCGGSAAALGLSQTYVPEIAHALEKAAAGQPPVIWLAGSACTGCSVSLLNTVHPDIKDVLLKIISLRYHQTVMAASGDLALEAIERTYRDAPGKYLLLVEGGVATAADGLYNTIGEDKNGKGITMLEWTRKLGEKAAATVSVGTCAAYGGIPAAPPNPTGVKPVTSVFKEAGIKTPVINVPGCPPHPDWMVGTLAHVLLYGVPKMDALGRPLLFFGQLIHDNCPYRGYYDEGKFAKHWGDEGCRFELGCKGPETYADCWKRQWNNGVNWCVRNAVCTGCVEPTYPATQYEPIA
jgi:hydrogenase small subunit